MSMEKDPARKETKWKNYIATERLVPFTAE